MSDTSFPKKRSASKPTDLTSLREQWRANWPKALAIWSRYTRLSDPHFCMNVEDERREHISESFAMIRLVDHAVVVSLPKVVASGVEDFSLEILAHEIGHHVYTPGDLTDQGRLLARIRRGLPTLEMQAPMIANLYTDLLINDRLQRSAGINIAGVYQQLVGDDAQSPLWIFYSRIYEILWGLRRGSLALGEIDGPTEGDAQLGARLIRSYAREWMKGAGRFAALTLRYLLKQENESDSPLAGFLDTTSAEAGTTIPHGLIEIDDDEVDGAIHPALDPKLNGGSNAPTSDPPQQSEQGTPGGQCREPFEFGAILRALGVTMSDHDIAVRYYRERAAPYLIPFPTRIMPESTEPLAEGIEPWDIGGSMEDLDPLQSILTSPIVIPGVTTVQRTWGTMDGIAPQRAPIDLDIYIDSSGSMPNPQQRISWLALAGTIIALSALRAGSRVQATLWSGTGNFETTHGFTEDSDAILRIITGYLGGSTAFPLHLLRDTYQRRTPQDRPVHILHISDDGIDTMLQSDEASMDGAVISREALVRNGGGGGTMALNLWGAWQDNIGLCQLHEMGWDIHRVGSWEDLVEFAREFSRRTFSDLPSTDSISSLRTPQTPERR